MELDEFDPLNTGWEQLINLGFSQGCEEDCLFNQLFNILFSLVCFRIKSVGSCLFLINIGETTFVNGCSTFVSDCTI